MICLILIVFLAAILRQWKAGCNDGEDAFAPQGGWEHLSSSDDGHDPEQEGGDDGIE